MANLANRSYSAFIWKVQDLVSEEISGKKGEILQVGLLTGSLVSVEA